MPQISNGVTKLMKRKIYVCMVTLWFILEKRNLNMMLQ